ncbi:MarR family transcriptional regulator [Halomicrococcus gelatinilyticus]|uniref:MarR family transcriptional regulator n=1 Tax=Halomicrococcus gelatinilyticus TaxID=1702103 RepID=UPI002E0E5532
MRWRSGRCSIKADSNVTTRFDPGDNQEQVLDVFKRGRAGDGPWGYANLHRIRLETGLRKQRVNEALGSLVDADWIEHVHVDGEKVRGLYRFVDDPRNEDNLEESA